MNVVYGNVYSDLDNLFSEKNNQAAYFEQVLRTEEGGTHSIPNAEELKMSQTVQNKTFH